MATPKARTDAAHHSEALKLSAYYLMCRSAYGLTCRSVSAS
jgi:hypothetical protein